MHRLVVAAALVASACGAETDDRPATLEYITQTILAPSCATAQCHSAFRRQVGDQFDTPEATRESIVANDLILAGDEDSPDDSYLVRSLTVGNPSILDSGGGNVRMPYDAPMPDADIELIRTWIRAGFPGAQCVPNENNRGCFVESITVAGQTVARYSVVECVDGNRGAMVETCTAGTVCRFDVRNGQCEAP